MDMVSITQHVVEYIGKRKCAGGGYCFYRLEEPNPHDTYFALATLELLRAPRRDEGTIRFLQAIQQPDGGYASLAQAFFVLSSLHFLESQPLFDPAAGVDTLTTKLVDLALRPADASTSFFQAVDQLATLRAALGMEWHDAQRTAILRAMQTFHRQDGGFGVESATLPDTYRATRILKRLDAPVPVDSLAPFLRACEHPAFGFTGKPGTALFYLEYLHAGLALCQELGSTPTFAAACLSALLRCQTETGGFARAHLAIATMDDTYRAVHGLTLLQRITDI